MALVATAKSPKSVPFPRVAIVKNSITLIFAEPSYPPAKTARVPLETFPAPLAHLA